MLDDEIGADNKVPSAITIGTYMVSAGVKDEAAATFSCLFYDKKKYHRQGNWRLMWAMEYSARCLECLDSPFIENGLNYDLCVPIHLMVI